MRRSICDEQSGKGYLPMDTIFYKLNIENCYAKIPSNFRWKVVNCP